MAGQKHTLDFTEGAITAKLVRFALPLLAGSLIQLLYNTVDLIFAGQYIGKEASAAVGASSMLVTLLVGLFTGLSVGGGVVVAKAFGGGEQDRVLRTVRTAVGMSVYGGLMIAALGFAAGPFLLRLMHTPESIMAQATDYVRVYFLSVVFSILYNMCSGCLRALGNSRFPMLVQLGGGLLNVLLDWLFIVRIDNGVLGVAYATLLCQLGTAVFSLLLLTVSLPELRGKPLRLLTVEPAVLAEILRVGVPAGLQSMAVTLSNVLVQSRINSLGVDVIAAFTAYYKVELVIYLPIMAFGHTMTTFSGQNMGAGRPDRVRKGLRICTAMSMAWAILGAILCLTLTGPAMFGWFNREPEVIALGMAIITVTFPFYWLYSILENLSDTIRGAGNTLRPMLITLCNICLLRTALLYLITSRWTTASAVAAVYPVTWASTALCLLLYWLKSPWSRRTFRQR